jgi:glutaredoxin
MPESAPDPAANATPRPMRGRDWAGLGALVLTVMLLSTWWQERQAAALGPAVAALARPGDIHMVSSVTCVYCTQARQWMQAHRVTFTECFIEREPACLQQYQALMAPGTPLMLVRGQLQRGFNPHQVHERLAGGG